MIVAMHDGISSVYFIMVSLSVKRSIGPNSLEGVKVVLNPVESDWVGLYKNEEKTEIFQNYLTNKTLGGKTQKCVDDYK